MPFCPKCGAEVSDEDEFCPRCGTSLREYREKHAREEKHEKREKSEKAEKGEKHEKGATDRMVGPITGGLIIIYLGITFYLAANNMIAWTDWWAYFLLGLGGILIIQGLLISAVTGRIGYGPMIGGAILCLIGASAILGIRDWWFLILIAVGLGMIVSALMARRRTPRP